MSDINILVYINLWLIIKWKEKWQKKYCSVGSNYQIAGERARTQVDIKVY